MFVRAVRVVSRHEDGACVCRGVFRCQADHEAAKFVRNTANIRAGNRRAGSLKRLRDRDGMGRGHEIGEQDRRAGERGFRHHA